MHISRTILSCGVGVFSADIKRSFSKNKILNTIVDLQLRRHAVWRHQGRMDINVFPYFFAHV
jgi:hypothetical protein